MLKRRFSLALMSLSLLFGMAAASLPASAESQARIVRLSFVGGDVQVDRDGTKFDAAFRNMPLVEGMRLWTGPGGRAEVEFEDGSTIRMVDNTLIDLVELRLRADGSRLSHVLVEEGTAYFDLERKDAEHFHLSVGGREVVVPRSARFRLQVQENHAVLAVTRGEVAVGSEAGELVRVRRNETVTLDFAEADRYYLAKGVEEAPWDRWDSDRRAFRDREAAIRHQRRLPVYGVIDLHHYGSYFHHPIHGQLWRPTSVGFGWHPYQYGAWVWYPAYGYVWVSAHPWGWQPYRFGSWIFVSNYGWCWRPSRVFVGIGFAWHRTPRILHAPATFIVPQPPVVQNTTVIVNVPRRGRGDGFRQGGDGGTRGERTWTRDRDGGSRDGSGRGRRGVDAPTDGAQTVRADGEGPRTRDEGEFIANVRSGAERQFRPRFQPAARSEAMSGAAASGRSGLRPSAGRGSGGGNDGEAPARFRGRGDAASRGGGFSGRAERQTPAPSANGPVAGADPGVHVEPDTRVGSDARTPAATSNGRVRPERDPDAVRARPMPAARSESPAAPAASAPPTSAPSPAPQRSAPAPAAAPSPSAAPAPQRSAPAPSAAPAPQRSAPSPSRGESRAEPQVVPQSFAPRQARPERPTPSPQRGAPSPVRAEPRETPQVVPQSFVPRQARPEGAAPARSFAAPSAPVQRQAAPAAMPARERPAREISAPARSMSAPSAAPSRGASAPAASPQRGSRGGGGRAQGRTTQDPM